MPTQTTPDPDVSVNDIVVTAQRRTERLQNVPISATVLSSQSIQDQNLTSLSTLVQIAPSVHIAGLGGGGRGNELFIRGVGSGQNQAFDQSVGTFIDDIYHGRSRTSGATFLDIERVEILKGPQTTFFGNNAIAGAFNIITKKPTDKFEVDARTLYGEDGQYVLEGAVSGPVTNTLGVRVATSFNGTNGWIKNLNTGLYAPREDNIAGRLTTVWKPNDRFDATLKLEATTKKNVGAWSVQVLDCPPSAPFVTGAFCAARLAQNLPNGLNNNANASSPGEAASLDTKEAVLTANYMIGSARLTSVTGYYDYQSQFKIDADFTPATLLNISTPERYRQFSQELRLASPEGRPIEYLAGLYYQGDRLNVPVVTGYFFLSPTIAAVPAFAALIPYAPIAQGDTYTQSERSYSVFGSLAWNATSRLKFSAALRSTWVHKEGEENLFYGTATQAFGTIAPLPTNLQPLPGRLGLGIPEDVALRRDDHALLPSGRVQYTLNEDLMFYGSYSRGFKAGGFNGFDTTGNPANIPFSPEHVNAYEVGLKSEFFARRLLLNLAAFRGDYSDLQVTATVANTGAVQTLVNNAGGVRSQGVELESQLVVTRDLRLSASATYLDAKYTSYPNAGLTYLQTFCRATYVATYCGAFPNPVPAFQNLSGRPTQYDPDWSGNVDAAYGHDLGSRYRVTLEGTAIFTTGYYLTNTDDPLTRQDGYTKIDARIGLDRDHGRLVLELIGKNLNNRIIKTFTNGVPTSTGTIYAAKEEPRNVAVQLRFRW